MFWQYKECPLRCEGRRSIDTKQIEWRKNQRYYFFRIFSIQTNTRTQKEYKQASTSHIWQSIGKKSRKVGLCGKFKIKNSGCFPVFRITRKATTRDPALVAEMRLCDLTAGCVSNDISPPLYIQRWWILCPIPCEPPCCFFVFSFFFLNGLHNPSLKYALTLSVPAPIEPLCDSRWPGSI